MKVLILSRKIQGTEASWLRTFLDTDIQKASTLASHGAKKAIPIYWCNEQLVL